MAGGPKRRVPTPCPPPVRGPQIPPPPPAARFRDPGMVAPAGGGDGGLRGLGMAQNRRRIGDIPMFQRRVQQILQALKYQWKLDRGAPGFPRSSGSPDLPRAMAGCFRAKSIRAENRCVSAAFHPNPASFPRPDTALATGIRLNPGRPVQRPHRHPAQLSGLSGTRCVEIPIENTLSGVSKRCRFHCFALTVIRKHSPPECHS